MDRNLPGSSVMGFFRQEYWSGLPFPSPWDLPNPVIEPGSPTLQADTLPSEPPAKPYASNHSPNADAHGLHFEDKGLDQLSGLLRTTLLTYQPLPKTLLPYVLA